jgi:hypothetical protein
MSNGVKRDMSPSLEMSKRQAIFETPPRPARSFLETCAPSCSTPTDASAIGLSNNRASTLNPICQTPSGIEIAINIPVLFPNDSQLRADELLLYSLMTLTFPIQTFSKNHASNKYNEIISVIFQIIWVKYSSYSIRNYFYRVRTNSLKCFGKSNGTCRWNYYQAKVKSLDISDTLKSCADLVELLNTVGGLQSCQGCNFDKYKFLILGEICDQQPVFKTKVCND